MASVSKMTHVLELTPEPYLIGAIGMAAICQNIRVILTTLAFSVCLDRAFAHNGKLIDSPAPRDTARLVAELTNVIERYEPRVKVEKLEFIYSDRKGQLMKGTLTPRVTFSLADGVVL